MSQRGKQNISDAEGDPSITEADTGKIEEYVPAILEEVKEAVPKFIEEVVRHANIENLAKEMTTANAIVESKEEEFKESTPVTDEKKPEILSKLLEVADKAKDELLEKAKEGGLEEVYKVIMPKEKAASPVDQPLDDDKVVLQERSVDNIIDEVKGPSLGQRIQDEVAAITGVVMAQAPPPEKEESSQGENKEKDEKEEDNCVASLAQGLQKVCAQWSNKKED
uniref:Uncharacterized protein n=1 Tax=Beta vulgaris TaxID=161934 RepID=A2I5E8_BETVU|nr:hypothetical protein [Beta vulgaris]